MNNQKGAIAIFTAIILLVFLGFVALSIDTGYLVASKNELQNAADAGALAGARELYNDYGTEVNTGANQFAYDAAIKNLSAKSPVEVNADLENNTGDIQRGHWSFGRGVDLDNPLEKGFYHSDSTQYTELFGKTLGELDNDPNFINAVKVTVRREQTMINTFFSKILGKDKFKMSASAVAYIGFAGSFAPFELNAPLAICLESITTIVDGERIFLCNIGRVIPSGSDTNFNNPAETGGWTDFQQTDDGECFGDGISNTSFTNAIPGNSSTLVAGNFDTGNGAFTAGYKTLRDQWLLETNNGSKPWVRKIPVISCPDGSIGNCSQLVGGVDVEILWITEQGGGLLTAPTTMESNDENLSDWDGASIVDTEERFYDFADHFSLPTVPDDDKKPVNGGEPYTPLVEKTIYFKPSCQPAIPSGGTGGSNLGVLAEIPVLVD